MVDVILVSSLSMNDFWIQLQIFDRNIYQWTKIYPLFRYTFIAFFYLENV